MKTNLSIINIIVAVSVITLTGCKKPIEEEVNPMCEYWAPEDCTFSVDKYNSATEWHEYFYSHDSTRLFHNGDTLRMWGWVYYHGPREPLRCPVSDDDLREAWSFDVGFIILVGNENHHGWDEAVWISWDCQSLERMHPGLTQNFDSLLQKKWYVTGIVNCFPEYICPGPCTSIGMKVQVIDIDTIPNN